ncbi:MAG: Z1 domain-containing protein [Candidatus Sericytochromatia bacterium]|nr:Z1 domain-containing protein [Candidatus Sericytochromatia bacterium]
MTTTKGATGSQGAVADGRALDQACRLVLALLGESGIPTREQLEAKVRQALTMDGYGHLDPALVLRSLESLVTVHVPGHVVIDDRQFSPWIGEVRSQTTFRFWNRYVAWLEGYRMLPRKVVRELDSLTDDILDRLRHPATDGPWDRRGLVVGDVQSGKTSNYTGLVCKAVDAGYKLVIVLAGLHDNLRSQTQVRIDEGFLGFDTRRAHAPTAGGGRFGAGSMADAKVLVAHSLTNSSDKGDFKASVAKQLNVVLGGQDPVILVVKKNVSILTNLLRWVLNHGVEDPEQPGCLIIRGMPVLVIDDEADHASVNTKEFLNPDETIDPEHEPSRINGLIRQLLTAFEQSAYVGYTATPFANVFMHHEAESDVVDPDLGVRIGEDLFPRSFILNMRTPDNHIGPERVFGMVDEGTGDGPMVVTVDDGPDIFPRGHRKDLKVTALPESLEMAMLAWLLVVAARMVRGDKAVHNSMLVHVTRYTEVQRQVADLVQDFVDDVRRQLEYPGTGGDALTRLEQTWNALFVGRDEDLAAILPASVMGPIQALPPLAWPAVRDCLVEAVCKVKVRTINGTAKEALDYVDHKEGLAVIAVGADKLSRGLTLEGLSVAYFLRPARAYDTLLQMGRWFGYRPRYADLCRLFTTRDLVRLYRWIDDATSELRATFDEARDQDATPLEFGHRVLSHPGSLVQITARQKMRAARRLQVGFSAALAETVAFDLCHAEANHATVSDFVAALGQGRTVKTRLVWSGVSGARVEGMLRNFRTARSSWKANAQAMADYVRGRLGAGCLVEWTVVLVTHGDSGVRAMVGPHEITMVARGNKSPEDAGHYSIKVLVDKQDEWLDLDPAQVAAIIEAPPAPDEDRRSDRLRRRRVRALRPRTRGLLVLYPIHAAGRPDCAVPLMGLGVSFPEDPDGGTVAYAANTVMQMVEDWS